MKRIDVPTANMNMNEFLSMFLKFDAIGVPDPIGEAVSAVFQAHVTMAPAPRKQLEDLVAFYRTHAKPGKVLAALKRYAAIDPERAKLNREEQLRQAEYLNILANYDHIGGVQ
jgi:hypothetical protein